MESKHISGFNCGQHFVIFWAHLTMWRPGWRMLLYVSWHTQSRKILSVAVPANTRCIYYISHQDLRSRVATWTQLVLVIFQVSTNFFIPYWSWWSWQSRCRGEKQSLATRTFSHIHFDTLFSWSVVVVIDFQMSWNRNTFLILEVDCSRRRNSAPSIYRKTSSC